MSKVFLRSVIGVVLGVLYLQSFPSGQGVAPQPEYFGFYALDAGKLIAIGDGKSDTPPALRQVTVATLRASQPSQRAAVQLSAGVHFLLFNVSPAEAARGLSIYLLPFVRTAITVPDIPTFGGGGGAQARPVNLPGLMRLASSQIRLLQKPVTSQPQMIELVPDPPLAQGLYAVLYAPATGIAAGGLGAGQSPGWTSLLSIGQASAAEGTGLCIDLILTGGLGGILGIDSPDTGSIASFPLLDPGRAPACSATSRSPIVPAVAGPVTPATSAAAGRYVRKDKKDDYLEFRADGTVRLQQGGKAYDGTFSVQGDTLIMRIGNGPAQSGPFNGRSMVDPNGKVWEKQD